MKRTLSHVLSIKLYKTTHKHLDYHRFDHPLHKCLIMMIIKLLDSMKNNLC